MRVDWEPIVLRKISFVYGDGARNSWRGRLTNSIKVWTTFFATFEQNKNGNLKVWSRNINNSSNVSTPRVNPFHDHATWRSRLAPPTETLSDWIIFHRQLDCIISTLPRGKFFDRNLWQGKSLKIPLSSEKGTKANFYRTINKSLASNVCERRP